MIRTIAPVCVLLFTVACSAAPEPSGIQVTAAWSRATPPGAATGVGYLTISNRGPRADRLVGVESPLASQVELHESSLDANGVAQMRPLDGVALPVGERVRFEPEGKHMMLVDLRKPLVANARVPLTLRFEHAPAQDIELIVQPLGADGPAPHEKHE